MFIRENKIFRTIISVFVAVSYLFVVLFSAQLHNHNSDIFKNLSFKKSEMGFSKADSKIQNSGDCLACHFLATGNSLIPEQFNFHFENHTNEAKQLFSVQKKVWSQTKFTFQLRGPPAFC